MATPLTADALLAALRAEGVTVVEVSGWRTHNRNHKGAWGPVNGVMVHHTVTGPGTDVVGLIYNGHSELPGPLATGCITKDGRVHLTANGRANHAGGGDPRVLAAVAEESYGDYPPATHEHQGSTGAVDGNAHFYGWECENEGDGQDPWPRVQYTAIVKATAGVCRAHGWGAKSAIGHLEWSDWKPDPRGFDMKDFRRDLAACLALPAGDWNSTEDDMALTDADIQKLVKALAPAAADAVWAKALASPTAPAGTSPLRTAGTFLRWGDQHHADIVARIAALTAAVQALAQDGGLPLAQVQAAAEAGARAALAELGDALTN